MSGKKELKENERDERRLFKRKKNVCDSVKQSVRKIKKNEQKKKTKRKTDPIKEMQDQKKKKELNRAASS